MLNKNNIHSKKKRLSRKILVKRKRCNFPILDDYEYDDTI